MPIHPIDRIAALPAYVPGRPATVKLASNENPYAPLPSVIDAITKAAGEINRYPDTASIELRARVAGKYGVPAEQVAIGAGSLTISEQILQAFTREGDEIVYGWRSFEAYPLVSAVVGLRAVQVPLREHVYDLDAMLGAITDRTRVVIVCNPNNPTGTAVERARLIAFLDAVPDDVLVIIDEAYGEYIDDPEIASGVGLIAGRQNACLLKTFSKAYGLAALRIGYVISENTDITGSVGKTAMPFSVSTIAQAAALASLDAEEELRERVDATVRERSRLRTELIARGWTVPTSLANFVWIASGADTPALVDRLGEAGISGRAFGDEGIRVTIGTPHENDLFLSVVGSRTGRAARDNM